MDRDANDAIKAVYSIVVQLKDVPPVVGDPVEIVSVNAISEADYPPEPAFTEKYKQASEELHRAYLKDHPEVEK